jgi:hypothetical protein
MVDRTESPSRRTRCATANSGPFESFALPPDEVVERAAAEGRTDVSVAA